MRCPDCMKFVGMENGEPEINSFEVDRTGTTFDITLSARHTRNCAECSTELKDVDIDESTSLELADFEGYKNLSEANRARLDKAIEEDSADLSVELEEGESEVNESGGGRYKANDISITFNGTVRLELDSDKGNKLELTKSFDIVATNTAGSYNECC